MRNLINYTQSRDGASLKICDIRVEIVSYPRSQYYLYTHTSTVTNPSSFNKFIHIYKNANGLNYYTDITEYKACHSDTCCYFDFNSLLFSIKLHKYGIIHFDPHFDSIEEYECEYKIESCDNEDIDCYREIFYNENTEWYDEITIHTYKLTKLEIELKKRLYLLYKVSAEYLKFKKNLSTIFDIDKN
jgi:hypothetical protein